MRNALEPGRENFPRQNLIESIAEPVSQGKKLNDSNEFAEAKYGKRKVFEVRQTKGLRFNSW